MHLKRALLLTVATLAALDGTLSTQENTKTTTIDKRSTWNPNGQVSGLPQPIMNPAFFYPKNHIQKRHFIQKRAWAAKPVSSFIRMAMGAVKQGFSGSGGGKAVVKEVTEAGADILTKAGERAVSEVAETIGKSATVKAAQQSSIAAVEAAKSAAARIKNINLLKALNADDLVVNAGREASKAAVDTAAARGTKLTAQRGVNAALGRSLSLPGTKVAAEGGAKSATALFGKTAAAHGSNIATNAAAAKSTTVSLGSLAASQRAAESSKAATALLGKASLATGGATAPFGSVASMQGARLASENVAQTAASTLGRAASINVAQDSAIAGSRATTAALENTLAGAPASKVGNNVAEMTAYALAAKTAGDVVDAGTKSGAQAIERQKMKLINKIQTGASNSGASLAPPPPKSGSPPKSVASPDPPTSKSADAPDVDLAGPSSIAPGDTTTSLASPQLLSGLPVGITAGLGIGGATVVASDWEVYHSKGSGKLSNSEDGDGVDIVQTRTTETLKLKRPAAAAAAAAAPKPEGKLVDTEQEKPVTVEQNESVNDAASPAAEPKDPVNAKRTEPATKPAAIEQQEKGAAVLDQEKAAAPERKKSAAVTMTNPSVVKSTKLFSPASKMTDFGAGKSKDPTAAKSSPRKSKNPTFAKKPNPLKSKKKSFSPAYHVVSY